MPMLYNSPRPQLRMKIRNTVVPVSSQKGKTISFLWHAAPPNLVVFLVPSGLVRISGLVQAHPKHSCLVTEPSSLSCSELHRRRQSPWLVQLFVPRWHEERELKHVGMLPDKTLVARAGLNGAADAGVAAFSWEISGCSGWALGTLPDRLVRP